LVKIYVHIVTLTIIFYVFT